MASTSSERVRQAETLTTYRTKLWAGGIAAAGAGILWAITGVGWFSHHTTTKAFLEQLGGLLVTTGGLAILWDLWGRRDMVREVLARVDLGTDIEAAGIRRASMDWRVVPWNSLIESARAIDVFIAYGSTWLSTHSTELARFANDGRHKMRYFLPDPEDETAMTVLAERFDSTPEMIVGKVVEAARTVAKLSRNGNADIRVRYRKGAPTFTCYRFDETIVVTLYRNAVGRGEIPTLVLERGSFSDFFAADLDAMEVQSREVAINDLLGSTHADR